MPTTANPLTASQARSVAMVVIITAFFGALWGLMGAFALPGASSSVVVLVVVATTAAFLLAAARFFRFSRRLPASPSASVGNNPFRTRAYRLAVLFQVVAIPVASVVLNNAGYPGAVVSAIAAIVGLHFFGLIPAFRSWRFAAVGGAMVLLGLLSLLVPTGMGTTGASPRGAVVGLGCALVLWGGVLPLALSTWRGANAQSN